MLTGLLNIRKTFHMNLVVTTITIVRTNLWVLYVLSYLVWCDYSIWVDYSAKSCACPLCCVFLSELGLISFNLELTFTSFPFRSVGTSHTPSLTHYISHTLATDIVILLASVRHHDQGITLQPTAGTPTPKGLRYNWNFLPEISP